MTKVLITGNKGFIGTRICLNLEEYENVIGYDLVDGLDIRNKFKLNDVFSKETPEIVIHMAALTGARNGNEFPEEYISTNINGTLNLLEMSKKYGVKHFIFFSSSSVYGNQPSPNKETDELTPISIYGITKATGEWLVKSSGVPYTIVRPFTVYGENGRKDQVIFKWLNQHKNNIPITFYGDGNTERGYTYVGDLVDGIKTIIEQGAENEIYNLGGNQIVMLKELLKIFQEKYPDIRIDYKDLPTEDIYSNFADISKAENKLNFDPQTNFKNKIREILNNYE